MNIRDNVKKIIENIGGKTNVTSVSHCATRLRLSLADTNKLNKEAVSKIDGVLGC